MTSVFSWDHCSLAHTYDKSALVAPTTSTSGVGCMLVDSNLYDTSISVHFGNCDHMMQIQSTPTVASTPETT